MGMSRCYALIKCLLILFNIIFLVVGLGACAFSGWALWEGAGGVGAGKAGLSCVAVWGAVLALGAVGTLRGVCGAGHAAALRGGLALLALACAAEAAAAAWGAAHAPQLRQALRDRLRDTITHDYGLVHSHTHMLDVIQHELQCCGAESVRDWQEAAWAGGDVAEPSPRGSLDLSVSAPASYYWVPTSCCATDDPFECETSRRIATASRGSPGLYTVACAPRVLAELARVARAPLGIAAALLAAHVLALLLALAIAARPKHDTRYKA
ncbi:Tetraspanin-1 [Papilio machaon]|uniref:Tetraspanin n=1 Tax=Papilio machaon TaxID=76193 RepID=A0A0N1PFA7_PAPMA|nr:Tetraspanin-1 [Papilio machaon]